MRFLFQQFTISGGMVSRKSAHQHKLEMQGLREKEAHSADEIMKMKKDESLGLKVAEVPHSLAMLCLLPP